VRLYRETFRRRLAKDDNVAQFSEPGREFLYRPGELLVAAADAGRVEQKLDEAGQGWARREQAFGVVPYQLGRRAPIPSIVATLRDPREWDLRERIPAVQPHHVLIGNGNIMGHPDGPPQPEQNLPGPDPGRLNEGASVTVGIVDTGIWASAPAVHTEWLAGGYTIEAGDEDGLFAPGGQLLAEQGGHGTFVAGVLRQAAPGVPFDPQRVLSPGGLADELALAGALSGLSPEVGIINLSLGCQTMDNLASQPLTNAISGIPEETVIVAAAGNSGNNRPNWPAAFDRVVAVAAVEKTSETQEGIKLTHYSNFGQWVDAAAFGEWVSTYVTGTMRLFDPVGTPVDIPYGRFARWSGTSFAAPYVAGRIAALVGTAGIGTAQEAAAQLLSGTRHPDYGVFVA
jgi:subtilisin family serine protease